MEQLTAPTPSATNPASVPAWQTPLVLVWRDHAREIWVRQAHIDRRR